MSRSWTERALSSPPPPQPDTTTPIHQLPLTCLWIGRKCMTAASSTWGQWRHCAQDSVHYRSCCSAPFWPNVIVNYLQLAVHSSETAECHPSRSALIYGLRR